MQSDDLPISVAIAGNPRCGFVQVVLAISVIGLDRHRGAETDKMCPFVGNDKDSAVFWNREADHPLADAGDLNLLPRLGQPGTSAE